VLDGAVTITKTLGGTNRNLDADFYGLVQPESRTALVMVP
jgi:hypothetical protein